MRADWSHFLWIIICPGSTVVLGHVAAAVSKNTSPRWILAHLWDQPDTLCFPEFPVPIASLWNQCLSDSFEWLVPSFRCCPWSHCCGMGDFRPRTVWLGHPEKREQKYPRNVINNQKYNFFTFLPAVSMSQRSRVHLFPFLWLLWTSHTSFRLNHSHLSNSVLHSPLNAFYVILCSLLAQYYSMLLIRRPAPLKMWVFWNQ